MKPLKILTREIIISFTAIIFYSIWGIERLISNSTIVSICLLVFGLIINLIQLWAIVTKSEKYDEMANNHIIMAGHWTFRIMIPLIVTMMGISRFMPITDYIPLTSLISFSLAIAYLIYILIFISYENPKVTEDEHA